MILRNPSEKFMGIYLIEKPVIPINTREFRLNLLQLKVFTYNNYGGGVNVSENSAAIS